MDIHKDDNTEEVMNVDPKEVQRPENVVRKENNNRNNNNLYTGNPLHKE